MKVNLTSSSSLYTQNRSWGNSLIAWILLGFSQLVRSSTLVFCGGMTLDSVKVREDWQSNKSIKNKKKKKNNVRNSNGEEEEEANRCWVKLRVMLCCVASTSDVDSSLSFSTTTGMPSSIWLLQFELRVIQYHWVMKKLSFWDAIFLNFGFYNCLKSYILSSKAFPILTIWAKLLCHCG